MLSPRSSSQVLCTQRCLRLPTLRLQVVGLQGADHSPSKVLFDAFKQRAEDLGPRLAPEQLHKLRKGFQHFGYQF